MASTMTTIRSRRRDATPPATPPPIPAALPEALEMSSGLVEPPVLLSGAKYVATMIVGHSQTTHWLDLFLV